MIFKNTLLSISALSVLSSSVYGAGDMFKFIHKLDFEYLMDGSDISLDLCKCDVMDGGDTKSPAGVKVSIVEPVGYIESTNTPWNFVGLGKKMQKGSSKQGSSREKANNKRFHHYVAFAPLGFLNFIQDEVCFESMLKIGPLFLSEIEPSNSDVAATALQLAKGPLSKTWYANMAAQLLSVADCAATTFHEPINSLLYSVGCAGTTGNNTAYGNMKDIDPHMNHHVLASIQMDELQFRALMPKTSNATYAVAPTSIIPNSMCGSKYMPAVVKTQYALQFSYPTVWSPTKLGMFRTFHADFKNTPASADDIGSWLWIKKDMCAGAFTCKSIYPQDAL